MLEASFKMSRRLRRGVRAGGEPLEARRLLAGITVTVNTTNDYSELTNLETAIEQINANGSPTETNTIDFAIPTTDPGYDPTTSTVSFFPGQTLSPITVPVTIDGTSESAYLGQQTSVVIDGIEEDGSSDGLTLAYGSAGSTIEGLEILDFQGSGLSVQSDNNTIGGLTAFTGNVLGSNGYAGVDIPYPDTSGNVIEGNDIGVSPSGANIGNSLGILDNGGGNTIGGTFGDGAANTIGCNTSDGILISGYQSAPDVVEANFIGTDISGDNYGNPVGISVNTPGNTIGGPAPSDGNVIGFSSTDGILIPGQTGPSTGNDGTGSTVSAVTGNLIVGNFIGTDRRGLNVGNVVGIDDSSGGNTIGGSFTNGGNIIGFNTTVGVSLSGTAALPDVIEGNRIGTDLSGANLANALGVFVGDGNNTIGGTLGGESNVIGFSTSAGVSISGAAATGNVLTGNYIGTDANVDRLGNTIGVDIESDGNTVGGSISGLANVFGFNSLVGVQISGTRNQVLGNSVGTDAAGLNLANGVGIAISGGNNTVGGSIQGDANVIGFNALAGISISGGSATGNVIIGNFVGTDSARANLGDAVGISIASGNNTIGGATSGDANVIGFNASAGVSISGLAAVGNLIAGNLIGTDSTDANLGNAIGVFDSRGANTIGGATPAAANILGFNQTAGIELAGAASGGDAVLGNLIGTDPSGKIAMSNNIGVLISSGSGATIGGTTAGSGNVISGNITAGIEVDGPAAGGIDIVGNRIGTDPTGSFAVLQSGQTDPLLEFQNAGIAIIDSQGNTIGGASSSAQNLISGNYVGVMLATLNGQNRPNEVLGNWIGVGATGKTAVGNIVGIYINAASGNQIGGTLAGEGNVISGNTSVGVEVYGSGASGNAIDGNKIGVGPNGTTSFRLANGQFVQSEGIYIENASSNTIGGQAPTGGNLIAGNQTAGIFILGQGGVAQGNLIIGNQVGLGLRRGAAPGAGNAGYGVLLVGASQNRVQRLGRSANKFGRNGSGNVAVKPLAFVNSSSVTRTDRLTHLHRGERVQEKLNHPGGPVIHRLHK
jgi:hypothetical protein